MQISLYFYEHIPKTSIIPIYSNVKYMSRSFSALRTFNRRTILSWFVNSYNNLNSNPINITYLQKHNLAESALGIGGILKCVKDFLERACLAGLFINRFPNNAVRLCTVSKLTFPLNVRLFRASVLAHIYVKHVYRPLRSWLQQCLGAQRLAVFGAWNFFV